MATRTLDGPPSILPLYARAAAPLIPGASLLPFIPGRGKEIPDIELTLGGVEADPERVAAYAKVCGFALRDHLPATYPQVLAFPLQMAVMADGSFPFGAVGLVHVENRIVQRRRIGIGEVLSIRVRPTKLESHPRGRTFSLLTDVRVGEEKVWEGVSKMLRRGVSNSAGAPKNGNKPELHQILNPADREFDAVRGCPGRIDRSVRRLGQVCACFVQPSPSSRCLRSSQHPPPPEWSNSAAMSSRSRQAGPSTGWSRIRICACGSTGARSTWGRRARASAVLRRRSVATGRS